MIDKQKCKRCGWEWIPRSERKPRQCPGCKTALWDRARMRKVVNK